MSGFVALVLAAGKGTRMKSALPKVLHPVCGLPMVHHVVACAVAAGADATHVVIGHGADAVTEYLGATDFGAPVDTVIQAEQLGTGHAVQVCRPALDGCASPVLILSGDVPLVTPEMVAELAATHAQGGGGLTLVAVTLDDPTGYGRVVRDGGALRRIVEQKDATPSERAVREVNAGIYLADAALLFRCLERVSNDNAQGEYYLTDIVREALAEGAAVHVHHAASAELVMGVNSRAQLAQVSAAMRRHIAARLMDAGVTLIDPDHTYVDAGVSVGPDTVIHPGVTLSGRTTVGTGCEIFPGARVVDSVIGDHVVVKDGTLITQARLDGGNTAGPNAHLRPGAHLLPGARVGNYVEIKKAVIGEGSKVNHLSYVGDATVGARVNIGAGTITCNYDGATKYQTIIEDDVFIGSDSQLVAPVRVGAGALVAAGSTITGDVPAGALGISRAEQRNVEGWVARWKRKRGGK
ncbi:MAG: bifunctional UDP-N-acetylglucosamine diphosphorylase/glucosamine-1-phosphate N-acetyltransferase GlmU [Nitrospirae bacterium]|nr:bifunctional UDP-N-acetylglucosamine diphosphorylase/glucosamine-1-phosphate N-acetyltransferase GlmU [Nitrospirota bacterium]